MMHEKASCYLAVTLKKRWVFKLQQIKYEIYILSQAMVKLFGHALRNVGDNRWPDWSKEGGGRKR